MVFSGKCAALLLLISPLPHQGLSHIEELRLDDLELPKWFGAGLTAAQDSLVERIVEDGSDGGVVPCFSLAVSDAVVVQEVSQSEFAVPGEDAQVEHHADDLSFFLIYYQPIDLMLSFVEDTAFFQTIAVGGLPSPEPALQHHLT